jgi:hypothetical protein
MTSIADRAFVITGAGDAIAAPIVRRFAAAALLPLSLALEARNSRRAGRIVSPMGAVDPPPTAGGSPTAPSIPEVNRTVMA